MTDTAGIPTITAVRDAAAIDPFSGGQKTSGIRFLYRLNPLAKFGAVIPAMLLLTFSRDLATPLAFLALSYVLLLVGARWSAITVTVLLVAFPLAVVVIGLGFSLWVDPAQVAQTPALLAVGQWTLHVGALPIGFATALRLAAIAALALIGGLTTTGPDLVRSSVQQLRVPYRVGYAALASYRFVPRFGRELAAIRAAHRVRGAHGGRGPIARMARAGSYAVPLLASAIRHAERVALAMDSRAFGAYATRTERYVMPFRARDVVFIVIFLAITAAWAVLFTFAA
ncbi:energy-coupling factor transporter transmembrane component T [Microbacterium sp. YY-01]|uniref:energy-coupling factor transporter transmembrane component T n=1 Tax=Microbacterium sp. YY-01 TaxID=3421634 RepID=UPI003D18356B